jgi:uncharacterized delta-60 repeat protein
MVVQPDGKVIGVGMTSTGAGYNALAFRLDRDGSLDPGFGYRPLGGPGQEQTAEGVALQPDGKIVVVGRTSHNSDGAVWRLLPDGAPDPDFGGGDGLVTIDSAQSEFLKDVAVAPNGSIVVVGSTSADNGKAAVYRLTPAGGYDGTLDGDGALGLGGQGSRAEAVAVQPDGRILVTGYFGSTAPGLAVHRLTVTGAPDPTFGGPDGQAGVALTNAIPSDLTLQPDGRVLVAGTHYVASGANAVVARFTSSGQADGSFGSAVGTHVDLGGYESLSALSLLPGGGVVASGGTDAGEESIVVKLDASGRPDGAFGTAGVAVLPGSTSHGYDVDIQPDGRILVIGDDSKARPSVVVHRLLGGYRPPTATLTCGGEPATISGTPGKDRINGTKRADVIVALGGNDVVNGLGGNDLVCAGVGNDTVKGGPGKDTLRGEQGKDRLVGGTGKDKLVGGPQQDDVTQ